MALSEKEVQERIRGLLRQQRLAVLSTQRDGQPYSSLMAFAYTPNLKKLLVATGKKTRKYQNILKESRVSLLVDNRSNSEEDFAEALAVTISGTAQEVETGNYRKYAEIYLSRHPYLENFLSAPSTSFLQIAVDSYLIVSQFQHVSEYRIRQ